MAGEWTAVTLGDVCDFRAGSVFKPALQGQLSGKYPFVKVSDMNLSPNAVRIRDANNWVSEHDLQQLRAKPFPPGTVVFAKIGEALRQNRLRQVVRETIVDNNMMGAVPNTDRVDPRFFYYALSQFDFSEIAQGTALPYLTVSALSGLELEIPPPDEQRAIAHILGTLDDKIELNRRMNETLEAMARAIFKSWFVDFDPVRAKAEGRDPGLSKNIADLFPDRFEDCDLGEIPAGWGATDVGALAEVTSGKRPPVRFSESNDDARVPLWGGNGPMGFVAMPLYESHILLTGRVGTLGSVFRITSPCWPSDNTLLVLARDQRSHEFLYFQLKQVDFASLNRGSTQPLLTQTDLKAQKFALPPENLLDRFHSVVGSLFSRIDALRDESRTLAALRDTLLPKLISGELRVKDAERIVEATA